jgi:aspartyl-tRNA(Asn)/glutamyl-tRNA(Gln) amidotransferase subunit C
METKIDVAYVARLSRLILTEEEQARYSQDLAAILDYATKLDELDTEGIEATAHVLPIHNVLREDEARPSYDRDKLLANAPEQADGCFKVPKVVE